MAHSDISDADIRSISEIIVGDTGDFYPYISGRKFAEMFDARFKEKRVPYRC